MGKLADKIKNIAKAAKSRREPIVHDIEIDDEPYMHDIEMEDDELDDIVVMSKDDLDNLDDDEFEKAADESQAYGNKKMGERRESLMDVFRDKEDDSNKRTGTASGRNKDDQDERGRDKKANDKKDKDAKDERDRAGRAGNVRKALSKMLSERNGRR